MADNDGDKRGTLPPGESVISIYAREFSAAVAEVRDDIVRCAKGLQSCRAWLPVWCYAARRWYGWPRVAFLVAAALLLRRESGARWRVKGGAGCAFQLPLVAGEVRYACKVGGVGALKQAVIFSAALPAFYGRSPRNPGPFADTTCIMVNVDVFTS
jgi:hypothetical protein